MAAPQEASQFSFEAAGRDPQYIEVNRHFVNNTLDTRPGQLIVDLGCGTGLISRLVRDRFNGVPATVLGIDPDPAAISTAKKEVKEIGLTRVTFYPADGRDVLRRVKPGTVDQIFMGNNVHELRRYGVLEEVMNAAATALKPGGQLAFNTTFVKEAMPEPRRWGEWKLETMRLLRASRDKSVKAYEYASVEEYKEALSRAGLDVLRVQVQKVDIQSGMLKAIAQYEPFIDGVCGDFVVPENVVPKEPNDSYRVRLLTAESYALMEAVDVMAAKHNPDNPNAFTLPRNWITVVMEKPKS